MGKRTRSSAIGEYHPRKKELAVRIKIEQLRSVAPNKREAKMSRPGVSLAVILLLGLIEVRPLAAQIPAYSEPSRKILRISLVCRDIEATSKLWAEILAVPAPQITMTKPSSESPLEFRGTAPSAEFKRALLQIGGTPVEFLQPVGSVESPEAEFTKNILPEFDAFYSV